MKITQPLILFAMLVTVAQPAFAYLDPGAGSFMLQMLIAGVMSAMFAIKMYWYRLKTFVARLLGRPVENEEPENPDTDEDTDKPKSPVEKDQ